MLAAGRAHVCSLHFITAGHAGKFWCSRAHLYLLLLLLMMMMVMPMHHTHRDALSHCHQT
jgi:hypothetical protein